MCKKSRFKRKYSAGKSSLKWGTICSADKLSLEESARKSSLKRRYSSTNSTYSREKSILKMKVMKSAGNQAVRKNSSVYFR